MPWTVDDVDKHIKGLTDANKKRWVAIANNTRRSCIKKGGDPSSCDSFAIKTANGVIKRSKEMAEITKTVSGKKLPASCFLVVPDAEKPGTWALPVKGEDGKPDHTLMGAAWAALHGGYRGSKYEGSEKSKATAALKKLYDDEGISCPSETDLAEMYGSEPKPVSGNVFSFDQLDAMDQAEEIGEAVDELTSAFNQMVRNIVWWYDGDKITAIRNLSTEFADRLDAVMTGEENENQQEESREVGLMEAIGENYSGVVANIAEGNDPATGILRMDVQVIQPGWGNKVDNNFYSAEVLKRDAQKFVDAKMYETDHRQEEKSTRTWVSTLTELVGFSDTGAPILRATVHDPNFAERVKNLNTAGLLEKLECSILGTATAEPGFELDGRKGKRVSSLVEIDSVDWVTRAGAGGKAIALAENDLGGSMEPEEQTNVETPEEEETVATEPVATGEATQTPPVTVPVHEAEPEPTFLAADVVKALLAASKLPEKAQERLSERSYPDEQELTQAIESERAYLQAVTGAGAVTNLGETGKPTHKPGSIAEAQDRVIDRYFGG